MTLFQNDLHDSMDLHSGITPEENGAVTFSRMTFGRMHHSIRTLGRRAFNMMVHGRMTLSRVTFTIITLSRMTLNRMNDT